MLVWVTEAKPLENFTLWLRFSDRSEGTVVWANGFDLAPEFLRARLDTDAAA
jgi:hypothetical protein